MGRGSDLAGAQRRISTSITQTPMTAATMTARRAGTTQYRPPAVCVERLMPPTTMNTGLEWPPTTESTTGRLTLIA